MRFGPDEKLEPIFLDLLRRKPGESDSPYLASYRQETSRSLTFLNFARTGQMRI